MKQGKNLKLNIFNLNKCYLYSFLKTLLFSFLFLICFFSVFYVSLLNSKKANASVYTTYIYAQIKSDDVYLYKTPANATVQNAYFALPNTYFVMLLSNYDEYFYKVQYRDIVGYVLKQKVFAIKEKPQTPYLTGITFRVYSSDGTKVYSSPFNTQDAVLSGTVEVFETVDYYGFILADELIENRGLTWYYGKTLNQNATQDNQENNQTDSNQNSNKVTGYFYSGLCDSLTTIPPNTENVTYTNNVFLDEDTSFLFGLIDLSPALKVLLVILISLPSVGLVYLLFKPFKIQQEKLNKNKSKNKNHSNFSKNNQSKKNSTTKNDNPSRSLKNENKTAKKQKNVLQNFKKNRNLKQGKNATINKIQKIIDDDIL